MVVRICIGVLLLKIRPSCQLEDKIEAAYCECEGRHSKIRAIRSIEDVVPVCKVPESERREIPTDLTMALSRRAFTVKVVLKDS
jgi:hypothetical protein